MSSWHSANSQDLHTGKYLILRYARLHSEARHSKLIFFKNQSGALQLAFILKTFAAHLSAIQGSILDNAEDSDDALPCGTLALAVTAVCTIIIYLPSFC